MEKDSKSVSKEAIEKGKQALNALASDPQPDKLKNRLKAVGIVSSVLETVGIRPILVGGNAVELYTFGYYTTVDVDLVLSGLSLQEKFSLS